MAALLLKTDGQQIEVKPANGTDFTLEELYQYCGSPVDIQRLPKTGGIMVVNDEAKLTGLPINVEASKLWLKNYPLDEFPINNHGTIAGDVLVCKSSKMVR